MSDASKSAAVQRAEKLLSPKKPDPTHAEEAAVLEQQRLAEHEKTARLRGLRLAKEAAEAKEAAGKASSKPGSGKRRKATQ